MSKPDIIAAVLKETGISPCNHCGRTLDRGDLTWQVGQTEAGTPHSTIYIVCQKCDHQNLRLPTWYPLDYRTEEQSLEPIVRIIHEWYREGAEG